MTSRLASARPRRSATARHVAVVGFAAAVLLVAGFGFVFKMTEFALTIIKDDIEGFGAAAIAIYLIGMLPIVFLTLWAVLTGRFRDIERPKHRMLELNADLLGAPVPTGARRRRRRRSHA
jgi:hypothetical protein